MEKIQRFKPTQEQTLEDFTINTIDNPKCKYCDYYNECAESMGKDMMEELANYGCSGFDTTTEKLKDIYIKEFCTVKT